MLTTEQFDNWLAALRSGKYKQAYLDLHGPEGFCCLGVLADLNEIDTISTRTLVRKMELPLDLTDLAVRMNDELGYDFLRIADALEKQRADWILDPTP